MLAVHLPLFAEETVEAILFTPPPGWHAADLEKLQKKHIKAMVIGQSKGGCPPSINLGIEVFKGTLKDYLKIVKRINQNPLCDWKDLGQLKTAAGSASLSQLDMRTEQGYMRMMHVILVAKGHAYVLTAAALKEEFSSYYDLFFRALTSLRFESIPKDKDEATG